MVKFTLYKYGVKSALFALYFGPLAVACRSRMDRTLSRSRSFCSGWRSYVKKRKG